MTRRQLEDGAGSPISRQDFNDRVLEVNSLRTELERVKKDKNITTGLVTQMQRDMANKVWCLLSSPSPHINPCSGACLTLKALIFFI